MRRRMLTMFLTGCIGMGMFVGVPGKTQVMAAEIQERAVDMMGEDDVNEEFEYEVLDDETIKITNYLGEDKTLEIPSVINGKKVTGIEYLGYSDTVLEVIIPDSINYIEYGGLSGRDAFYDCNNLKSIVVSNDNDIFASIDGILYSKDGKNLILCPPKASEVVIPDEVTTIEDYAFTHCSFQSVILPQNITSIGAHAFSQCDNLISIEIPDGVTSVKTDTFYGCDSLTDIIIPDSVTDIGEFAFACCGELTNITIPDSVINIGESAFEGCKSLVEIELSKNLVSIGQNCFKYCSEMACIKIPESLTNIKLPVFTDCSTLTNIEVSELNKKYTSIDGVLYSNDKKELICCPEGKDNITILDSVTKIGEYAFSNCNKLENIVLPDSVVSIGANAFNECSHLTTMEIPNGVTSIEEYTFNSCASLQSIKMPDSITNIGKGAFYDCFSLKNIKIPEYVMSLQECTFSSGLESIVISDSVINIDEQAFLGNHYNDTIFYVHANSYAETFVKEQFWKYSYITDEIACAHEYTSEDIIKATCTTDGERVYNCAKCGKTKSEIVKAPGHNWDDGKITKEATETEVGEKTYTCLNCGKEIVEKDYDLADFDYVVLEDNTIKIIYYCGNEKVLYVPSMINGKTVTAIGEWAFAGCTKLEGVFLPDGLESIEAYAFEECNSLKFLVIPVSVKSINENIFTGCSEELELVVMPESYAEEYAKENGITVKLIGESSTEQATTEKVTETTTEKATESTTEKVTEVTTEKVTEATTEKVTEATTEKATETTTEKATEATTEKATESTTEKVTEATTEKATESTTEKATESTTEKPTETTTEQQSGNKPVETPAKVIKAGDTVTDSVTLASYKVTGVSASNKTVEYTAAGSNAKSVVIPATVTVEGSTYKVTSIAKNAFKKNKTVEKVVIGNNVTTIGDSAFENCTKLKSVTIGKNITTIGNKAFYKCSKLTKVTISNKVNKIGKQAFGNCKALKSITIKTTKLISKNVGSKAFKGIYKTAKIKVPKSKLKAYKKLLKAKGIGAKVKVTK